MLWGDKDYIICNAYTQFYMVVYENPRISLQRCMYLSIYAISTCCMPLWKGKFKLADGERSECFDRCVQELGWDKKTTLPITSWSGRSDGQTTHRKSLHVHSEVLYPCKTHQAALFMICQTKKWLEALSSYPDLTPERNSQNTRSFCHRLAWPLLFTVEYSTCWLHIRRGTYTAAKICEGSHKPPYKIVYRHCIWCNLYHPRLNQKSRNWIEFYACFALRGNGLHIRALAVFRTINW